MFPEIAKPLTELIKKDVQFKWEERQQTDFDKLKEILCSGQVLAYLDFNSLFILTTNVSRGAVAGILSQLQNGVERPISYSSRQINKAERNYSATEAELLAVTLATKHFTSYLYGERFVVRTAHSALTYIHMFADNNSRLIRWPLRLAEFEFEVQHRAGTKIKHVDALSRHVQSVTVDKSLSRDRAREEQKTDRFFNTLEVGRPKGKSEYFYDEEGVINRRRKNAEHQLVVPKSLAEEVIG